MQLDIRVPIGILFTLLGLMLVGFGLVADDAINARSLGHDLNLWWGLVMALFGLTMLYLARRGRDTLATAMQTPEGQWTERREKAEGLEQ